MASVLSAAATPYDIAARLVVWPPSHPLPNYSGTFASCVRKALEFARHEPPPHALEIHLDGGYDIVTWAGIVELAARADFPPSTAAESST
jgi:hypothetical protein